MILDKILNVIGGLPLIHELVSMWVRPMDGLLAPCSVVDLELPITSSWYKEAAIKYGTTNIQYQLFAFNMERETKIRSLY